ncbi:hypothetical protein [Pseudoxanthomonas mexicana]|jgi:hypothetical protein|uniref:hypothetical protein n=1 Tax=Pseudoxanthomonas mexicana TaxID=128785 RepID=UPI0022F3F24D|nr:hypothetical protein [Pseudoxanthomonas mexicana]WBX93107.1 hypothetical protein PE064_15670 [Pseudoxanthomonas mexicana]
MNSTEPLPADARRPDAPIISDVRHLGARGALYLLSLVHAHNTRVRLAPTPQATHALLSVLVMLGLIRIDPQSQPDSNVVAGEKIAWTYTWTQTPFTELEGCLKHYLTTDGRQSAYARSWLEIWQELMPQEVTAYLQHQLRIHQFSDVFLSELAPILTRDESQYSLGHWRYACWAAVRSMASVSLQYPGNAEILKFTLSSELPRRLRYAQAAMEGKLCFSPSHSLPDSALTRVFSTMATDLGDTFWMSSPALELI